jgi:hypothetical protein
MTGIGKMSFQTSEAKYNCEFTKDKIEEARKAVADKLSARLEV